MYIQVDYILNPIALRKAKIAYNFGLYKCKRLNTENTSKIINMPIVELSAASHSADNF